MRDHLISSMNPVEIVAIQKLKKWNGCLNDYGKNSDSEKQWHLAVKQIERAHIFLASNLQSVCENLQLVRNNAAQNGPPNPIFSEKSFFSFQTVKRKSAVKWHIYCKNIIIFKFLSWYCCSYPITGEKLKKHKKNANFSKFRWGTFFSVEGNDWMFVYERY